MGTPLPQDLMSRFGVRMFDEQSIIGVPTGFSAFFAGGYGETVYSPDQSTVDITIIRGDERIAPLIPRGMVSRSLGSLAKNARSSKHSEFSRTFPLMEVTGSVSAANLLTPLPGEPRLNSDVTRMFRLRYHAARQHNENYRRVARTCEVLAAQAIMTGKQDAILGTADANLKYDYKRSANLTIQCGTSWKGGTANILADIDGGCIKLRQIGHMTPDMALMGADAIDAFIRDATVQKLADNRRFTYIALGDGAVMPGKFQRFVEGGFIFQGLLRTPQGYQLALFSYPEFYTDNNGNPTAYIAADKVLLASSTSRCDKYFGPPEQLPMTPTRAQFYREYFGFDPNSPMVPPNIKGVSNLACPPEACFCAAYNIGEKAIEIEMQCAPIFVPVQTDAYVVLDTEP